MLIKGSEAGKLAGKEGGGRRQALTPVPKHVNLCVWRGITLSPPLPHKWKMIHVADQREGKLHASNAYPFSSKIAILPTCSEWREEG